jgi:hypothetical protein
MERTSKLGIIWTFLPFWRETTGYEDAVVSEMQG